MKISKEYCEANGFTPEKIADTMLAFYKKVDERSDEIIAQLKAEGHVLRCRPGCCGCCRDELSMTQAEAAVIRKLFPDIGKETPHAAGACPFLNEEGLCRIYPARPYICRTHGLPMRSLLSLKEALEMGLIEEIPEAEMQESSEEKLEIRDICDENVDVVDVMELPEDLCWTEGVAESQIAAMDLCTFGSSERILMRSFFQN